MRISFEGQVVVITGGGGGLGRAQAIDLARRGAAVVVNDIGGIGMPDGPLADEVVAEIQAEGGRAIASYDSIVTPDGGRALVERALDTFGSVDALLHYAGDWRHVLMQDMTHDQLDPVLDVHLRGAFFVTQPLWPILQAKGYGRIVLCSSGAGAFGRRWGANYAAAKAGLLGLSRALALEGAEHGILTNCLLPMAQGGKRYQPTPSAEFMEEFKSGHGGAAHPPDSTPERVIGMPTFLASRECTVNGEAFSVGGGRYARVFTGVSDGWLSDAGEVPDAEDISDHLTQIRDLSAFTVPDSVHEEIRALTERIARRNASST